MSFFEAEASKFLSRPIELYHFRTANQDFYFTSSDQKVFFADQTWIPQTISRTKIVNSNDLKRSEITVSIAQNSPLNDYFFDNSIKKTLELEIFSYQANEQEGLKTFAGTMIQQEIVSEVEVNATFAQIGQFVLNRSQRYKYSYNCNNVQYDQACNLSLENNSDTVVITSIDSSGRVITFADTGRAADYYIQGLLWIIRDNNREDRFIQAQTNGVEIEITIDFNIEGLQVGDTINVAYGCKRTSAGCKQVGNIINYMGFEFTPLDNYFTDGIRDNGKGRRNNT